MFKLIFSKTGMIVFLIGIIFIALIFILYWRFQKNQINLILNQKSTLVSLWIFEGENHQLLSYDIIFYNKKNHKMATLELPLNWAFVVPRYHRLETVQQLYQKNKNLLKTIVSTLLGIYIDYSCVLPYENIGKMVDFLGGLSIYNSFPIDNSQGILKNKSYLLPPGQIFLEGDKAITYLSQIIYSYSYLNYYAYHSQFYESFWRQCQQQSLKQWAILLPIFYKLVKTQINQHSWSVLFLDYVHLNQGQRGFFTLPVYLNREKHYYIMDLQKMNFMQLMQKIHSFINSSDYLMSKKTLKPYPVNILNGSYQGGAAGELAKVLSHFPLPIKINRIGNADSKLYKQTLLIGEDTSYQDLEKIGQIIHCHRILLLPLANPLFPKGYTIIVGKDFNGRFCR